MGRAMLFEEILLLAYRDKTGKPATGSGIDFALASGVLCELVLADRIRVRLAKPDKSTPYKDTFEVIDQAPVGDPEADTLLQRIAETPDRHVGGWLNVLVSAEKAPYFKDGYFKDGSTLRFRLLDRMIQKGVLQVRDHKMLGLLPLRRYPMVDPTLEATARDRIGRVMAGGPPDAHTAVLVMLLVNCQLGYAAYPGRPGEREKLANRLAGEPWGTEQQRQAVSVVIAGLKSNTVSGLGS